MTDTKMLKPDKGELIKLDMAMDYPVNWGFDRIIRDLVQNFYDSIGSDNFAKEFKYSFFQDENKANVLIMETYGHPFSYEWLTYIGGSTKTDHPGDYVGMYGEGFKICALCLVRQNISLCMESEGWRIEACEYTERIENSSVPMLGYKLYPREDDGMTRLTLTGIKDSIGEIIETASLNYFYPENPLLGEKIYECNKYAIYHRSKMRIPCTQEYNIPGVLFCNRLARGRLSLKLAIQVNVDMDENDSRARRNWDYFESMIFLNIHADIFDPESSFALLEHMERYWNDCTSVLIDFDTWYYVICQLVRNVASDECFKALFMQRYTNLVYIDRYGSDAKRNRYLTEAYRWAHSNPRYAECRFVNPIFRLLGASSVMDDYEKLNHVEMTDLSGELRDMSNLLFDLFEKIWPYTIYDTRPEVVLSSAEHIDSMQYCERDYRKQKSGRRYRVRMVALSTIIFAKRDLIRHFWSCRITCFTYMGKTAVRT